MAVRAIPTNAEGLRKRLAEYEARFGVPSEHMRTAFQTASGELIETRDLLEWSNVYTAWRIVVGILPSDP